MNMAACTIGSSIDHTVHGNTKLFGTILVPVPVVLRCQSNTNYLNIDSELATKVSNPM